MERMAAAKNKGNTMYVITVDFRYYDKQDNWNSSKTYTIGCYEDLEVAIAEGNKMLDKIEKRIGNKFRDRFSANGGLFGNRKDLVADMSAKCKRSKMEIYAHLLEYQPTTIQQAITEVKSNCK